MGDRDAQRIAGHLLGDLWRLVRRATDFPNGNLTVGNTLTDATRSATDLADRCGGVAVVGLASGGFFLNGERLLATSVHYRTLYRMMNTHQITSATFTSPVSTTDLADLVIQSAGITTNRPSGGTIRINHVAPLEDRSDTARRSDGENRFRAWVNRWRDTNDRDRQIVAEAIVSSDETRHYQAWLDRTHPKDDTETAADLDDSYTPDWLHATPQRSPRPQLPTLPCPPTAPS